MSADSQPSKFDRSDALLVVDVQNDFCPGGSLPIEDGDEVVPVLNRWIEQAKKDGVPIVASRDWHPPDHCSFEPQGGQWPVHCVRGTDGAEFHPDLNLPDDCFVVSKAEQSDRDAYSAFEGTDLAALLRTEGVRRLWIGGLAQDVCVKATALDAVTEGFLVRLIPDATRPVTPEGGREAMEEMAAAGVQGM